MWHGDADNTLIYSKTTNFPFSVLHSLGSEQWGGKGRHFPERTKNHFSCTSLAAVTTDSKRCQCMLYREGRKGDKKRNCNRGKISGRQFSSKQLHLIGGRTRRMLVIIRCPQLSPSINQHIAAQAKRPAHTHTNTHTRSWLTVALISMCTSAHSCCAILLSLSLLCCVLPN